MLKKLIFILILLLILLSVSCTKVEVISDPYWDILVKEFRYRSAGLKVQALLNGKILIKRVLEGTSRGFDVSDHLEDRADVYLFSPLLSKYLISSEELDRNGVYYLFENESLLQNDNGYSIFTISYDRTSAFFAAGVMISGEQEYSKGISIIFDKDNSRISSEAESFLSALSIDGNIPEISRLEIDSSTSESDIEEFFNNKNVVESVYIVIFTDKWKKICYDLSVGADKRIVTSDFWFNRTFKSDLFLSVENDMQGLMKKVYINIKKDDHRDISLNGILR